MDNGIGGDVFNTLLFGGLIRLGPLFISPQIDEEEDETAPPPDSRPPLTLLAPRMAGSMSGIDAGEIRLDACCLLLLFEARNCAINASC